MAGFFSGACMTTITFDPDAFRLVFPAFADPAVYPDAVLQVRFDVATFHINPNVYPCGMTAGQLTYCLQLMTAHLQTLATLAAGGNVAGIVIQSKVGDVQVGLAPPPYGTSQWRYWLNLTPWGQELLALLSTLGAGGFYVGGLPESAAFRKFGGIF